MRLMIWVGDEGPTDNDLKDGDIFSVHADSWVPGTEELKKFLVIQTSEYQGTQDELVEPQYATGPSADEPDIRYMRKYRVDYWKRLTADELVAVRDPNVSVPVMVDRFSLGDIVRK